MMTNSEFVKLTREALEPLFLSHGIRYSRSDSQVGSHAALFIGADRAVEVSLDHRDGLVEICMYKVKAGSIVRNPLVITSTSVLTGFNINDFLCDDEKAELSLGRLADRDSADEVRRKLEEYKRLLSQNQAELLEGHFRVPAEVEKRIKERLP